MSYRHLLFCALLVAVIAGLIWGLQSIKLSRWNVYHDISLRETRERAIIRIESPEGSTVGCGVRHWENVESVCRFEDPWRVYVINFDPATKLVNRKRFYFKFVPGRTN